MIFSPLHAHLFACSVESSQLNQATPLLKTDSVLEGSAVMVYRNTVQTGRVSFEAIRLKRIKPIFLARQVCTLSGQGLRGKNNASPIPSLDYESCFVCFTQTIVSVFESLPVLC